MTGRAARREQRRSPGGIAVSIALHVIAIAALTRITFGSHSLLTLFQRDKAPAVIEQIGFVALPDRGADTPGRRGGDGRPVTADPVTAPPPLIAPATVPTALPPVDSATAPTPDPGGRGPLIGGGGPLRGIQPSFSDPRIWAPAGEVVVAPKSMRQRVDSSIIATVERHLDSLAALPIQRESGDWTFERGGKRYGIDREYIRLGDVSIPTSVLALLPLNVQGNPIALERERAYAMQRADIDFQVRRSAAEDEFKAAVKRIRARVEAERAERERLARRGPVRPDVP